ncbi:HNH endonuclease [Janibacter limosus]|uniref:HNH endonuclease n=1 Tax=Janibacter limosus TaxID=53458 RepID=A0A4P6MVV7_9MICO|nr:DUF222 domain-containing protein [Janibacter limosus]QBF47072.1 HNH endonuclease [Janibacter limosus]
MTDQGTDTTVGESMVGDALPDRLAAALEVLSGARAEGLSEAELLQVVTVCEATKGAAAALQARATAMFVEDRDARVAQDRADGVVSAREASCRRRGARAELALARRCSPGQADRHVGLAKSLVHDLPYTMAALTAGELSEWRATIVTRETACLSHEDRVEADRRLAGCLTTVSDKELAAAAHRASADLDAEALVRRRRKAVASRNVSVRPAADGMAWLSILGPLADVVGAFAALKKAEQGKYVATGDPEVDAARAADERGRGAWMADTALELLSGRCEGQVQPVEVGLVMREEAIVRTGEGSGASGDAGSVFFRTGATGAGDRDEVEVPGWGAMPGEMAREHLLRLCDAGTATWLRRLWTAPGGNDLVAMDSKRRLFSGVLRQLVELRDATCRVPFCGAPIRDIDHVRGHARGGETSAANAMSDCQGHNLVKEAPGWRAEVTSTGLDPGGGPHEVTLTTPTGSEYICTAPPLLGHGRPHPPRPRSAPALVPDLMWSPLETHLASMFAA